MAETDAVDLVHEARKNSLYRKRDAIPANEPTEVRMARAQAMALTSIAESLRELVTIARDVATDLADIRAGRR